MLTHFFAGCLLAVAAVPDVVIPGTRSLRVTRHLEVSPLTEHCCVQHVVAKGETLSAIAAAHYGKATTAKDIAALNPEINPDRLKIGQRLWLPPRIPAKAGEQLTFVYFVHGWRWTGTPSPYTPTDKIMTPRHGQLAWLLVPQDQMAAFAAAQKQNTSAIEAMAKDNLIQILSVETSGGSIPDESPIQSCTETITISRSDQGKFSIAAKAIYYDKQGKVLTAEKLQEANKPNSPAKWLLMLPFLGGGLLLLRARRQRPSQPIAAR